MSAIAVDNLTVELGGRPVVDGVSVAIEPGEWFALIGPNGAGKTTLLRAITGLATYSGIVRVAGRDLGAISRRERARLLAYAPQISVIYPEMSVQDFVALGRTPYWGRFGRPGGDDVDVVEDVLTHLDLAPLSARAMASLSGGERQRAVLAQALAQDTQILVLDEPTTSLDVGHQQQLLELVDTFRRSRDVTVVTTLHDLSLAGQYADRLALMDAGRVQASGAPAEVLTAQIIRAHYGVDVRTDTVDGRTVVSTIRPPPVA